MVTAGGAREPEAYRDSSNRVLYRRTRNRSRPCLCPPVLHRFGTLNADNLDRLALYRVPLTWRCKSPADASHGARLSGDHAFDLELRRGTPMGCTNDWGLRGALSRPSRVALGAALRDALNNLADGLDHQSRLVDL